MHIFIRLVSYLKPYRLTFIFSLCLVGLVSALELLKPWPLKMAVDQIIGKQPLIVYGRDISFGRFIYNQPDSFPAGIHGRFCRQ